MNAAAASAVQADFVLKDPHGSDPIPRLGEPAERGLERPRQAPVGFVAERHEGSVFYVRAPCAVVDRGDAPQQKRPRTLAGRGHIFKKCFLFVYSAASVSPAGTVSSESPMPPLTSMKLRRRLSSNARRRRA